MNATATTEAMVTIVVVPRERFSCVEDSLNSIYEHKEIPFKLVYVDGNAPEKVRDYLSQQAPVKNFQIVRTNYYLSPNQARNLGLAQAHTKYVAFIDNDVIVSPGWLKALVDCAEETNATIVGPLMCQHKPLHEIIHFAGGESHIWVDNTGRRRLREKMYKQGKRVADVRHTLQRTQTELSEFHCVLVRRDIFDRVGLLDEAMLNTKEHLDFCMSVTEAGGTIYFEPASLVTYVPGPPLEWTDLPFYMLRWSDAWTLASLHRLRDKWNLAEDGYFQGRYKKVGCRRLATIISPLVYRLTFGRYSTIMANFLVEIDRIFNRYLTTQHAKKLQKVKQGELSAIAPSQG
ncbi:glycosyltransferase family 2 protein [Microseira wollei]|uniref:Glycosyl transferase n=1 Tax=Microseira wollei NIES-4236 TaxID=2530354 RepID=A0AAV3X340_9CYAN|nr:glycosyltransferase [Microseira wollei]GET37217.1 putative glycosyl transferase [Microseira wollei NIES-4236]